MGFFDDDPFENIIDEFFGRSRGFGTERPSKRKSAFIRGEEEERAIDFIEDEDRVYLIFELPGYNEKDVVVVINGKSIEITAQKKILDGVKEYLAQKLSQGSQYKRNLPDFVNPKKFSHSLRNGILEVCFEKKEGK